MIHITVISTLWWVLLQIILKNTCTTILCCSNSNQCTQQQQTHCLIWQMVIVVLGIPFFSMNSSGKRRKKSCFWHSLKTAYSLTNQWFHHETIDLAKLIGIHSIHGNLIIQYMYNQINSDTVLIIWVSLHNDQSPLSLLTLV